MFALRILGREAAALGHVLRFDLVSLVLVMMVAGAVAVPAVGLTALSEAPDDRPATEREAPSPPTTAPPALAFAFAETDSGEPVAFDSCDTLSVRYDPIGEPYTAAKDIAEAVRQLSVALDRPVGFQDQGSTDGPTIAVTWVPTSTHLPGDPGPDTVGTGGFTSIDSRIISGTVTLSADADLAPGFGPHSWGIIYLHELGHAVGLAHVQDPDEVMHPSIVPNRPATYGPGDLQGLGELGGPCEHPQ
ncbi:MAG: hypothetical protein JJLCMIEE_02711 [Acidimicrobiales bacterium]|nr:hypothetical protein [Acidimicrobiales bacterium]